MIGTSKVWFCGQDGSVYELTGQGSSWFPQYGKNFTYTGEYQIVPEGDSGDWKVKFLTSGTFTATDALLIDVFAVGGGGGAGAGLHGSCGTGGGGGYTRTNPSIYLEKDKSYEVVIGAGGKGYPGINIYKGTDGGATSGFSVTANGGGAGYSNTTKEGYGGSGGSGGGAGIQGVLYNTFNVNGGSDGSDGYAVESSSRADYIGTAGKGQGTTTREFGEESGDLYAGGGGGMVYGYSTSVDCKGNNLGGEGGGATGAVSYCAAPSDPQDAAPNTGGGGGGTNNSYSINKGNGGSGILIIRNHRE